MNTTPLVPSVEGIKKPELSLYLASCNRSIKMVYGLEMDLRRMLPDPTTAMQLIMNDAYTQDYVVRRCLTVTKKMILQQDELITFDDVDIDSDDVEKLLAWVMEHSLYFFMKRASGMAELSMRFKMAPPQPSLVGSEDSHSPMPSAGPLTA